MELSTDRWWALGIVDGIGISKTFKLKFFWGLGNKEWNETTLTITTIFWDLGDILYIQSDFNSNLNLTLFIKYDGLSFTVENWDLGELTYPKSSTIRKETRPSSQFSIDFKVQGLHCFSIYFMNEKKNPDLS